MTHMLCVIPGDGIGKEVIPAAVTVLQAVIPDLETVYAEAGWDCFQKHGVSVPPETVSAIHQCRAALFGAVSSPSHRIEGYRSAIITLRQELDLYANLRPVRSLPKISPRAGINFMVVRENTEGLYSGREWLDGDTAVAERVITRHASYSIGLRALELARGEERKLLTIVHKANVLPITDGLFRDSVLAAVADFQDGESGIKIEEMLVDTAAFKLAGEPEHFEVIVTTNLFGDILSDEAAYWCGGMGLAPSLNWGSEVALAEPVHGSAPDIAGQGIANPIASILSAALLARYAWKLPEIAARIETGVHQALEIDLEIRDGHLLPGLSTKTITDAVLKHL
jgi:homoisocitrate dehydrogenase